MKGVGFRIVQIACFWTFLFGSQGAHAQGLIRSGTFAPITPPNLANHHVDAWSVVAPAPIRTFETWVRINPMNQVQPGGSLSVFPTLLSPAERNVDSHLLFDVSSATILEQNEDTTMIRAKVEFTSNFPTSFDLVKAVARDGHSPYEVYVFGTYLDGSPFSDNVVFVPEPSVSTLVLLGFFAAAMRRKSKSQGLTGTTT